MLFVCLLASARFTQAQLTYTLRYQDSTSPYVSVRIEAGKAIKAPVQFIMPRSIPGVYAISRYDAYIDQVNAVTSQGRRVPMVLDESGAPRWAAPGKEADILGVEYRVNVDMMERQNLPSDASLLRSGFAGFLNYSVFGWIEGLDNQALVCKVETYAGWPVFSTNIPALEPARGSLQFRADDYPALADGQIFMGPRLRVKSFAGKVPLFVASFGQTADEYLDDYGSIGMECMDILDKYYGALPFQHFTLVMSKSLLPGGRGIPGFAMEHLNSSSFIGDTTGLQLGPMSPARRQQKMSTILHHMAHTYIPLRCYAGRYRPRPLELPPLFEAIWLNEGSAWFILYDVLKYPRYLPFFRAGVYETAPDIKGLSMTELSYLASTMYALDFRTGQGIFSRGALMFIEMDTLIRSQTRGQKSMRDVFRYLWQYTRTHSLPVSMEQLPKLMSAGCGVDLSDIYRKWQGPVD
jgi:predicted metalloprotease with PDZ domain